MESYRELGIVEKALPIAHVFRPFSHLSDISPPAKLINQSEPLTPYLHTVATCLPEQGYRYIYSVHTMYYT
jgi:hypothetical protein